ncbi:MAG: hypothetical protein HRU38_11890 [Saccharospirillaceae bacterium]|nr:YajG family lipoprotein [Pseudomonadales bacterium]NRB79350.1 hypothetical protein [Saccharospirillaceae bacterium]
MKGSIKSALSICAIVCGLSAVSCAVDPIRLSKPIGVPVAQNKVNGLIVRVSIEDVRGSQVLGSRGGLYSETSLISTDVSLIDQIGDNIIQAMKTQGYQLQTKAPANLQVKLEELTYNVLEINRTTKDSKVFAKMSFYVEHSKGYIQKSFNVTLAQTTVFLPTQKSIESLINDALIQVMQNGLNDIAIQAHITQAQSMQQMITTDQSKQQTKGVEPESVPDVKPESEAKEIIKQQETKTFKLLL